MKKISTIAMALVFGTAYAAVPSTTVRVSGTPSTVKSGSSNSSTKAATVTTGGSGASVVSNLSQLGKKVPVIVSGGNSSGGQSADYARASDVQAQFDAVDERMTVTETRLDKKANAADLLTVDDVATVVESAVGGIESQVKSDIESLKESVKAIDNLDATVKAKVDDNINKNTTITNIAGDAALANSKATQALQEANKLTTDLNANISGKVAEAVGPMIAPIAPRLEELETTIGKTEDSGLRKKLKDLDTAVVKTADLDAKLTEKLDTKLIEKNVITATNLDTKLAEKKVITDDTLNAKLSEKNILTAANVGDQFITKDAFNYQLNAIRMDMDDTITNKNLDTALVSKQLASKEELVAAKADITDLKNKTEMLESKTIVSGINTRLTALETSTNTDLTNLNDTARCITDTAFAQSPAGQMKCATIASLDTTTKCMAGKGSDADCKDIPNITTIGTTITGGLGELDTKFDDLDTDTKCRTDKTYALEHTTECSGKPYIIAKEFETGGTLYNKFTDAGLIDTNGNTRNIDTVVEGKFTTELATGGKLAGFATKDYFSTTDGKTALTNAGFATTTEVDTKFEGNILTKGSNADATNTQIENLTKMVNNLMQNAAMANGDPIPAISLGRGCPAGSTCAPAVPTTELPSFNLE